MGSETLDNDPNLIIVDGIELIESQTKYWDHYGWQLPKNMPGLGEAAVTSDDSEVCLSR